MLRALVMGIGIIFGVVFFLVAAIYFLLPANHLPAFMPGYDPDLNKIHSTHGLICVVLGALGFLLTWLRSWGD